MTSICQCKIFCCYHAELMIYYQQLSSGSKSHSSQCFSTPKESWLQTVLFGILVRPAEVCLDHPAIGVLSVRQLFSILFLLFALLKPAFRKQRWCRTQEFI